MYTATLDANDDFEGWRRAARAALLAGIAPEALVFTIAGQADALLLSESLDLAPQPQNPSAPPLTVPKSFLALAKLTLCHSHPERFSTLYKILYRLQKNKALLSNTVDADIHRANRWAKEVRRDVHKMKAFVRFRKIGTSEDGKEDFAAWFEPSHHIVRIASSFFVRRFHNMNWSILTPDISAHWRDGVLNFFAGVSKAEAPNFDPLENYWESYFASTFNPARLKINAMTSEMPKKYWKNLPEAKLIPGMIAEAQQREQQMRDNAPTLPTHKRMKAKAPNLAYPHTQPNHINTLAALNDQIKSCQNCPLWQPATQAVCGKGPHRADIMLVGEQPGDNEDLMGEPFIGPAGQVLQSAMAQVGIEGSYLTNAVKHFKFKQQGKRRIHQSPTMQEIDHCAWWLHQEIAQVQPRIIVALGISAARGITGQKMSIQDNRQQALPLPDGRLLVVTRHPASILRAVDKAMQHAHQRELEADLAFAKSLL